MSGLDTGIAAVKLVAIAAALPATAYIVPMWGTTPSSFVLAAIGSVMSYAWDKREDNGFGLVFKTMSVTLFSVACVVVLPDLAGWELRPASEPPLAFILALFGRHIIPALRNAAPSIARGIAGMFTRSGGGFDDYEPPKDDPHKHGRGDDFPDDRGY